MNQTIETLKKYKKKNTRIGIANALTFISMFFTLPLLGTIVAVDENGEMNFWKFIIFAALFITFYVGIVFKIIFNAEENNLRKMLAEEKTNGTVIMFNPYLTTRKRDLLHEVLGDTCNTIEDKKYFLFFYPYKDDLCTMVKYPISEELYFKYKSKVENYKRPFNGAVPVVIDSNTGLFDNKFDYTTKNLDWDFLEY